MNRYEPDDEWESDGSTFDNMHQTIFYKTSEREPRLLFACLFVYSLIIGSYSAHDLSRPIMLFYIAQLCGFVVDFKFLIFENALLSVFIESNKFL